MSVQRVIRAVIACVAVVAHSTSMPLHALAQSDHTRAILAAADKGDAQAQFAAGVLYEAGKDLARDAMKASEWYHRAAAQGHGSAQAALGYLFQTGQGVQQDAAKAAEWYRRSAASGSVSGQFQLAVAYINGIGVPRDARAAAEWMFKAAEAGDQQAQLMFATMLQAGTGVKRNEFAARRWFDKAASGPDSMIAGRAASMRAQIDERVLFSDAFRSEDIAAVVALGFGLAALMYALAPSQSAGSSAGSYSWQEYQPPQVQTYSSSGPPNSRYGEIVVVPRGSGTNWTWERRYIFK